MKHSTEYNWYPEDNEADCIIYYKDQAFLGQAHCHPQDGDVMNEYTGLNIAEMRAMIKYLGFIRDYEIMPALKASNQLYYAMSRSKEFNKKSYEAKMLYRQIQNYTADLDNIREEIKTLRFRLKDYIDMKEKYYQAIRKIRADKNK